MAERLTERIETETYECEEIRRYRHRNLLPLSSFVSDDVAHMERFQEEMPPPVRISSAPELPGIREASKETSDTESFRSEVAQNGSDDLAVSNASGKLERRCVLSALSCHSWHDVCVYSR